VRLLRFGQCQARSVPRVWFDVDPLDHALAGVGCRVRSGVARVGTAVVAGGLCSGDGVPVDYGVCSEHDPIRRRVLPNHPIAVHRPWRDVPYRHAATANVSFGQNAVPRSSGHGHDAVSHSFFEIRPPSIRTWKNVRGGVAFSLWMAPDGWHCFGVAHVCGWGLCGVDGRCIDHRSGSRVSDATSSRRHRFAGTVVVWNCKACPGRRGLHLTSEGAHETDGWPGDDGSNQKELNGARDVHLSSK